ncbi:hypothetical protein ACFLS1_07225 [Verrucomicrobiota bacterium]
MSKRTLIRIMALVAILSFFVSLCTSCYQAKDQDTDIQDDELKTADEENRKILDDDEWLGSDISIPDDNTTEEESLFSEEDIPTDDKIFEEEEIMPEQDTIEIEDSADEEVWGAENMSETTETNETTFIEDFKRFVLENTSVVDNVQEDDLKNINVKDDSNEINIEDFLPEENTAETNNYEIPSFDD